MFVFRKFWRAFFSLITRFEIRPFGLLPTKCVKHVEKERLGRYNKAFLTQSRPIGIVILFRFWHEDCFTMKTDI